MEIKMADSFLLYLLIPFELVIPYVNTHMYIAVVITKNIAIP